MALLLSALLLLSLAPQAAAASAHDPLGDAIAAKNWQQVEALAQRRLDQEKTIAPEPEFQTLTALGIALNEQGRFAEADTVYRRALDVARSLRPENPQAVLGAEENVALETHNLGRYAEAERLYRSILAGRRKGASRDVEVAMTLNRLASTIGAQGRYAEADPLLREALALRLQALGPNDPLVAQCYNLLAINLEYQGKYAEAEPVYRRALEIRRKAFGDVDASVATTLSNLALNLQRQGGDARLDEAGTLYVEAMQIARKVWGDDSPNTASTFNNVANYLEQYGQYAEAEKMYRFVLDIRVSQLGESHPHTLVTLNNLAYNVDQQGRTPDAIALYRTVLDRQLTQIGRSHPDLIVSYNNLAVLLARTTETRGEALALAREAVELSRRLKARERSGFAAGGNAGAQALTRALAGDSTGANRDRYAFELMLNTAWARAQDAPSNAKPLTAEAFETAQDLDESAAGRAMALTSARLAAGTGPLAALVQRQQDLSRRASEIDAEIVRALSSISAAEIASRRHQADAINGELAAVDAGLRRSFPRYQDMISPSAISKDEVRRRLGRDEGLLLIIPSGYDIYSFALSGRGLLWSRWDGGVAKARSLVDRLRCQADPVTCAAKDQEPAYEGEALPFDRAGAFELYRSLIEPVEAMLRGKAVVFATTSGPLADLPLQLLLTAPQAADSDLASAPWLGERYAFVTLPTVAALRSPRERRPARSSVPFIGFGAPSLSGGASADDQAFSTLVASRDGVTRGVSAALRRLAPLPGTQVELNAMARVLAAPEGSVHLGARATETALRSEPATASARVLAFATHGLLPREIDGLAEPALVLTPPMSVTPDDDGILTASEAAVLPLGADWVILSACNTASSHGGGADSLSALARGFLYAGAGALLASHWRVSDDVTAALTVETLREAKHDPGRSRAAAFMRAERAVRTGRRADGSIIAGWNADWAHPSSWAPFSLISDGD